MAEPANEYEEADTYRAEFEPLWTEPLAGEFEDRLPADADGTVLAAEVRCGYLPMKMRRLAGDDARIVALEPSRAMLDKARERAEDAGVDDIFFVDESVESISYASDVFEASVCFDGLVTPTELRDAASEISRVTVEGGPVVMAVPLADSFGKLYDLLEEALREHGADASALEAARNSLVEPARLLSTARNMGLGEADVARASWEVEYDSGRSLLDAPLLRRTVFPLWSEAISMPERDAVLRYFRDALQQYWRDRPVRVEVVAGCLFARVDEDE
ncbi:MAG: class I SAM-dependent methyltransferase [Bradymonadaceae bacterium]